MTFNQIMSDLKKRKYAPVYLLMGEESYYIDQISDYIAKNVLQAAEKDFNQTVVYGKDTTAAEVVMMARRYPMMAKNQVVIVKEAQNLRDIEKMAPYMASPLESTILVLNHKYKSVRKNTKLYKSIAKNGVAFESKKLYDNQVPAWIKNYLDERNYTIQPANSMLLTEFLGNDLKKIANELDKLIITLPTDTKEITAAHIEKNIGISKDYNSFELTKALAKKDVLKSNKIINYFAENQKTNHISLTIASLYYYFAKVMAYHFLPDKSNNKSVASALKVHPFFVTDYKMAAKNYPPKKLAKVFSYLREADVKSKGVGNVSAEAGDLLKELIFKILH